MTDGRVFTVEDELDVIDDELGKARRELDRVERAPSEGRWCGSKSDYVDRVETLRERIVRLERERAEYFAERIAAAEGFVA